MACDECFDFLPGLSFFLIYVTHIAFCVPHSPAEFETRPSFVFLKLDSSVLLFPGWMFFLVVGRSTFLMSPLVFVLQSMHLHLKISHGISRQSPQPLLFPASFPRLVALGSFWRSSAFLRFPVEGVYLELCQFPGF